MFTFKTFKMTEGKSCYLSTIRNLTFLLHEYITIMKARLLSRQRESTRISSNNFIYFLFIFYRNYRYRYSDVIDVAETEMPRKSKVYSYNFQLSGHGSLYLSLHPFTDTQLRNERFISHNLWENFFLVSTINGWKEFNCTLRLIV